MKRFLLILAFLLSQMAAPHAQLASLGGSFVYPPMPLMFSASGPPSFTSYVIDATGEKAGHCFSAPFTGNIDQVGIRFGTVTVADDVILSLQNPSLTTGNPDETADQQVTIAAASVITNTFQSGALDAARAVTVGEVVCLVVDVTFVDANLQVSVYNDNAQSYGYSVTKTGAPAWAKGSFPLVFAIRYDTTVWASVDGVWPVETSTLSSYVDATNPDERGNKFTIPFKARAIGYCGWIAISAGGNYTVNLFDSNDTSLGSVSHDGDLASVTGSGFVCEYFTTGPVTLSPSTVYRLAVRATASASVSMNELTLDSDTLMTTLPGGANIFLTTRNNGTGSWTDTATSTRAMISLMIDQLDAGAGGGGGSTVRGIIGGQ